MFFLVFTISFVLHYWETCSTILRKQIFLQTRTRELNKRQFNSFRIFMRESSYCFQRVLAMAILSVCLSVFLSVRPSHGWISQKWF